jgi:hypothetical protein
MPPRLVDGYLSSYTEAVQARLEHAGAPLQDWLAELESQR